MSTLSKIYELCEFSCAVSIQGISNGRGNNLAHSDIQSEHRIHFNLPAGAASYMIKWFTELDTYWPIIYYPISRSQVSTCGFSRTRVKLNSWTTAFNTWWSVDGLMNYSFFFFLSPLKTGSSVPEPKYREKIYTTVNLKFLFNFLSSFLLPVVRGGNE